MEDNVQFLKVNSELLGEISIKKELVSLVETTDQVEIRVQKEAADRQAELEQAQTKAVEDTKVAMQAIDSAKVVESAPVPVVTPKVWENKLSAGYSTTNGNTKNSHANISLDTQYNKGRDLWKIKTRYDYGSDKGRMNVQKFYSKAQNDYRLGENSKWFNTRSVEVAHDKFSKYDYRLLPTLGIGYWFWEGDDSKAEFDTGLGYEYTNYNDSTKATGNFVLVPHAYLDKVLIGKLKFAQDITMYPSLDTISDYRLRSESSLVNPLNDVLSWKLSLIDEYNSSPKGGAKKNDTTLMTSIEYAF